MKSIALLLAVALLPACVGQVVDETAAPPEHTMSCVLDGNGAYGGFVACEGEVTRDNGEHACGGCAEGAACTAYYTMATGTCR